MNTSVKNNIDPQDIFALNDGDFNELALSVFRFQCANNEVYKKYCDTLKITPNTINNIRHIPYLPIQFFKSQQVKTTEFNAEIIFESSGTTKTINSRHYVKSIDIYEKSFNKAFRNFYGDPADWCILALLPSYLERNNSSLVLMADQLIKQSGHELSGFYLDDFDKLKTTIIELEKRNQKTLLLGVTFALIDFAALATMPLKFTNIMETGGMKGRREEITRQEVHQILKNAFMLENIHSEYGMTELLSQAYSAGDGKFLCPPWMKILLREEDDPFNVNIGNANEIASGAINIIDLANIYSCSFIATDDAGKLYKDGSFEVLGRLDNADIRGCSLLSF